MRLAKMMMAVAACSLATTPVLAAPAASKLSVSASKSVRGASAAGESNELNGGWIVPAVAIIAVILGVIVLVDEDDKPQSPG